MHFGNESSNYLIYSFKKVGPVIGFLLIDV